MEKKFTKIIHTTYELLDFFPDGDPLKTKAKEKALAILDNLTLISSNRGDVKKMQEQIMTDVEVLEQYLELGRHQGWLGGFNFLILLKEYHSLKEEIKIQTPVLLAAFQHAHPVLEVGRSSNLPRQSKFTSDITARQGKILKMLEKKEKIQVADILKEVKNVTKRTLRRDLDDLLKRGKIQRVGEWNQASYKIGHNRTI